MHLACLKFAYIWITVTVKSKLISSIFKNDGLFSFWTTACRYLSFLELRKQESRAIARKPRDAAAVGFDLKFTDSIHYKFKSSQASKARLQSSKHTGAKQNLE